MQKYFQISKKMLFLHEYKIQGPLFLEFNNKIKSADITSEQY